MDALDQMKANLAKKIDEENLDRWRSIRGILFDAGEDADQIERAIGSEASMQKTIEFVRLARYLSPKERFDVATWFAIAVVKQARPESRDKVRSKMIKMLTDLT